MYEAPIPAGGAFTVSVPHTDFGTWRLEGEALVLKRADWRRIDFERCNSSAQILDWILHYSATAGLTPQEIADMVQAIDVILHPRKHYCSSGQDKRADGLDLLRRHLASGSNQALGGRPNPDR